MKKRIFTFCLILMLALLTTACTQGGDTPDDWPSQTTQLELQYSYFRITNAAGETLIYDENGLHGSMKVESENTIIGGPQYPSTLILRVEASDYFVYESMSTAERSFSVRAKDYHGLVRGKGLQKVTANIKEKSVSVDGTNMSYHAELRIAVPSYEYFILEGENAGAFSMSKKSRGVVIQGVEGTQKVSFANADWKRSNATELNFTGNDSLDLSQVAANGTITFSNQEGTQSEIAASTFSFGGN